MRKSLPTRFLVLALLPGAAWAQRFQNQDMFFSAGPVWSKSRTIAGGIALAGAIGWSSQTDYGYQIARASAASLLLDISFVFGNAGTGTATIPGAAGNTFNSVATGFRFRVPVHPRVSFHAVADGGFGTFRTPVVNQGASASSISSRGSTHGVFVVGGGADVRLSPRFSLRTELRDLVTGRELSGASGPHHLLPLFGVAFHL